MPETISSVGILLEKNKLATDNPWLVLLDVVLNDANSSELFYVKNTESITYNGNVYTAVDFSIDITKEGLKGDIPTITLSVANVDRIIGGYVEDADGALGSTVTVSVINNGTLALRREFSVVTASMDGMYCVFGLGAPNLLRQMFPLFRFIADSCNWRFKYHECGYVDGGANRIIGTDGKVYVCLEDHQAGSYNKPISGTGWYDYWRQVTGYAGNAWATGTMYGSGTASCHRTLRACRLKGTDTTTGEKHVEFIGSHPGLSNKNVRVV